MKRKRKHRKKRKKQIEKTNPRSSYWAGPLAMDGARGRDSLVRYVIYRICLGELLVKVRTLQA